MLVLTRRKGEGITINDTVKIQVLRVKGKEVWIGIDAPQNMAIYRDEIYARVQEEREAK